MPLAHRLLITFMLTLPACSYFLPEKPAPTPTPTEAPPTPEPTVAVVEPEEDPMAKLEAFVPRVTWRKRKSLAFEEMIADTLFRRFDVVQTYTEASAEIRFFQASLVKLKADTLFIINLYPEEKEVAMGTLRGGKLGAKTAKEIWLVTSAALLRLRAQGKTDATGDIEIKEGKQLTVALTAGAGLAIPSKQPGEFDLAKATLLSTKRKFVLAAPQAPIEFGMEQADIKLPSLAEIASVDRRLASIAPPPGPIVLKIVSPEDYTEVNDSSITIRGLVTGPGGSLSINGKSVSLDNRFRFNAKVPLRVGPNSVILHLNRPLGAALDQRLTIIRRK